MQRPVRGLASWQACCGLSVACPKPASLGDVRHFGPPSNPPRQLAGLLRPSSAAGRPVAASLWPVRSLPPLFLWASEGDVRHFRPPSNPPRQPAGLLRPLCGLSEACLLSSYGLPKATLGILDRLQTLLGSWHAGLLRPLWPVRSLPPLFLWASEGDVRHFGPPSNPPRQPAGLLRPLCGLSEACLLSSYGLPKATLGILGRLQTLLGSRQACCGLSVACPKPASSLLMGFRRRR